MDRDFKPGEGHTHTHSSLACAPARAKMGNGGLLIIHRASGTEGPQLPGMVSSSDPEIGKATRVSVWVPDRLAQDTAFSRNLWSLASLWKPWKGGKSWGV